MFFFIQCSFSVLTVGAPFWLGVCVAAGRRGCDSWCVLLSGSPQHNKRQDDKTSAHWPSIIQERCKHHHCLVRPNCWPAANPRLQPYKHDFAFVLCGIESQKIHHPPACTLALALWRKTRGLHLRRCVTICTLLLSHACLLCLTRAKHCVHNPCFPCSGCVCMDETFHPHAMVWNSYEEFVK